MEPWQVATLYLFFYSFYIVQIQYNIQLVCIHCLWRSETFVLKFLYIRINSYVYIWFGKYVIYYKSVTLLSLSLYPSLSLSVYLCLSLLCTLTIYINYKYMIFTCLFVRVYVPVEKITNWHLLFTVSCVYVQVCLHTYMYLRTWINASARVCICI